MKDIPCYLCLAPVRNLIGYLVPRMIGDISIHVSFGDYRSLQSEWSEEKKEFTVDILTVIRLHGV